MATHSSVLAWRIPGMGSLVGCSLWDHTESDTTEVTWQQQQQVDQCQWIQISPLDSPLLLLLLLLSRFSRVQLCATPETAAHQAPPYLGFSLIRALITSWRSTLMT